MNNRLKAYQYQTHHPHCDEVEDHSKITANVCSRDTSNNNLTALYAITLPFPRAGLVSIVVRSLDPVDGAEIVNSEASLRRI